MEEPKLRAAVYRLVTDMIKLDNIISARETDIVDSTVRHFGITAEDMKMSSFMKLSEAMDIVSVSSGRTAQKVYDILHDCARSDEICSRDEAMLLHCVNACIRDHSKSRVISVANQAIPIQNDKIIYVSAESLSTHPVLDNETELHYLRRTARLAGFELIYIPKACQRYAEAEGKETLRRVLPILSPGIDERQIETYTSRLAAMSSGWFLSHVLIEKFHFPTIITSPVWMMRLHDNIVDGESFANFLITEVSDDIPAQIEEISSELAALQVSFTVSINNNRQSSESFEYTGFMRSILEMMERSSQKRWEIVIRTIGCKEFTGADGQQYRTAVTIRRGDDEWPLVQGDRDASFYALVLMSSAESGGLHLLRGDMPTDSRMQRRYEMIYSAMRTGMDSPIIAFYKTRNPIKSRLIKTIREDIHLDDKDLYQIAESSSSLFIPLDASHVKVLSRAGGRIKESSLLESALYADFLHL